MPAEPLDPLESLGRWAASGAAWLTGEADGPPLGGPTGLTSLVARAWRRLLTGAAVWGDRPAVEAVDPMGLLGERAALAGLRRRGAVSCGGATRLLAAADGWVAVALPRPDDVELLPAWLADGRGDLGSGPESVDVEQLAHGVGDRSAIELVERAALLGLAVTRLGEIAPPGGGPVIRSRVRPGAPPTRPPLVVDLSALWAGPLATQLLAAAGAIVVKVESWQRPDGLRRDGSGLFDVLNAGKRCVALDLGDPAGVDRLRALLGAADIVVEASRPRALVQLGIDAAAMLDASARPKVWVSITAHGRAPDAARRVGFGDDAAVAGGLVAWAGPAVSRRPCFLADAIADPLTGLVAAAEAATAYGAGTSCHLDVALSRVAATARTGTVCPAPRLEEGSVARPHARTAPGRAAPLGADTADVLAEVAA